MKQLLIFMIFLQGCGNKYFMPNMLGGENIDVSKFIRNGYTPAYCDGKIYKLINTSPDFNLKKDINDLNKEIKNWLSENGFSNNFIIRDTTQDIVYQYSYLLTDYPIDTYTVKVWVEEKSLLLFFRTDKGILIRPLNSSGWIFSKCDINE